MPQGVLHGAGKSRFVNYWFDVNRPKAVPAGKNKNPLAEPDLFNKIWVSLRQERPDSKLWRKSTFRHCHRQSKIIPCKTFSLIQKWNCENKKARKRGRPPRKWMTIPSSIKSRADKDLLQNYKAKNMCVIVKKGLQSSYVTLAECASRFCLQIIRLSTNAFLWGT